MGPGKPQRGYTLIEVLIAMMVIAFSLVGLVHAFIYGYAYVEKFGLQRQAMILLDAEMENLLALKSAQGGQLENLGPLYEKEDRQVDFGNTSGVTGVINVNVANAQYDQGLKYWDVHVRIQYENSVFSDTASLSSRFYWAGAP